MLLTNFKVKIYPKNSLIAVEGDIPKNITIMMKGQAKVYRKLAEKEEIEDKDLMQLSVQ